ncbi:hypothetical protein EJB05_15065, partial [Eragrostis curvula]
MDGSGAEEAELPGAEEAELPGAGSVGPGASVDTPPSSPPNPPPADLDVEPRFGGWPSLEDWDNYLTMEEENLELYKQLFEEILEERKRHVEKRTLQLEEEKRQTDKKEEEDRARLDQKKAELDRREEELDRQERELKIQVEALNKFLAMEKEQLQKPLLVQPDHNNNMDYNAWDLTPIVWVLPVVGGLAFLAQMCTQFPLVYLKYIVVAFAVLWGLGSVVLSFRIFERFRGQNTLGHYAARLAFLCFTLLGLYALYVVTVHLDAVVGTSVDKDVRVDDKDIIAMTTPKEHVHLKSSDGFVATCKHDTLSLRRLDSVSPDGRRRRGGGRDPRHVDSPPSSPRNPPPSDLAVEERFGGWPSLEDWDAYLTREEEKLEQKNRQLEEECRADWAKLEADFERKRRFEQHLDERWSKLQEETVQLAQEKWQIEKKMEEDRARWDQVEAELQRREDEVDRRGRDLDIQKETLNKFLAMQKEQLQKPLLVQPDHDNNMKCDAWDLSPIVRVLAVVSGLAFPVQMCNLFPLVYLKHIVVAFAALWAMGSVVLSFRIFEIFRGHNSLGHHAARLAFLCFTHIGLYALYLVSVHLDDISRASQS